MEKIILKPVAKEFLHKGGESGVAFDAFSYQGGTNQEKKLGAFSLVGHIKYGEEDMSYLISLVSSLAKREYYSEGSLQGQDPRSAFERTLKKINEVLEDFFDKKEFKLNLGLMAVSGENIYISKLGKFRVALARGGKYIDILNNVDLFNKDVTEEKQFSNIISGKVKAGDKIFAYFPTRQITAKEKQLNPLFIKGSQEEFGQKIAQLASTSKNFALCGIYMDMKEIKEIPIKSAFPGYAGTILTAAADQSAANVRKTDDEKDKEQEEPVDMEPEIADGDDKPAAYKYDPEEDEEKDDEINQKKTKDDAEEEEDEEENEENAEKDEYEVNSPAMQHQKVMAAELSVGKRNNAFSTLAGKFSRPAMFGGLAGKNKRKLFTVLAVIVIVPLLAFVVIKNSGSSESKKALTQAEENLKLAKDQMGQSKNKEARASLQAALLGLTGISGGKADKTKAEAGQILNSLDKISEKQPVLFLDWSEKNKEAAAKLIATIDSKLYLLAEDGSVYLAGSDGISNVGKMKADYKLAFGGKKSVIAFDGAGTLALLNPATKAVEPVALGNPVSNIDATFYEGNLYTLSENKIYKYADIANGDSKRIDWGSDSQSGALMALAADGNIFGLTGEGKLVKYFKGKKDGEMDLQITPSAGSRLFTSADSAFVYIADKAAGKVYVFGKTDGSLKTTYKLDNIGEVKDVYISGDGTVWIISTNKAWKILP